MIKQLYRFLNPKFQNLFLAHRVRPKPRYGHGKPAHPELLKIIDSNRETYEKLLKKSLTNKKNLWEIKDAKEESDKTKPAWNNGYLPGLDIIGIYTILARFKPKRYIEIGSGNSTKVAHKAFIEKDLSTEFISIDPKPRAEIDQLPNRMIREEFDNTRLDIVHELDANDVLFLDKSHHILPNSDSMVFFMEILPRLKRGVIVHFHDIYLPYDYPQFMCDRFYTEQYGLAFYLLSNPDKYEPILPNYYISEDPELSELIAPIWDHENLKNAERHGGSFWIRIAR